MGTLYIVATPIGNLKDITFRAVETLKGVDYILCEDTRVSGRLLSAYDIPKKLESLNDFSEERKIPLIISDLDAGKNLALISDAGTPLVSDPGYKLVREAIARGIKVESIPGPTAAIATLTVSGLPPDKFLFLGYLPKKPGKRAGVLERIKAFAEFKPTVIIYESPHRLLKTLTDIKEILGDVNLVICRELTKIHEEVRRETVSESLEHFSQSAPKGEFTLLLSPGN